MISKAFIVSRPSDVISYVPSLDPMLFTRFARP